MKQHSISKIIGMLMAVIFLIAQPIASVDAQTAPPLSINQLYNATLPYFDVSGAPTSQMITLNNGEAEATDSNGYIQYDAKLDTDSSSYVVGDFLNAGISDIAATVEFNYGGNGVFYFLVIFINNGGNPQYLTAVELGDDTPVNSVSYYDGIFTTDINASAPWQGGSADTIVQYQLQNGSLVEMSNPSDSSPSNPANNIAPAPVNLQNQTPSSPAPSSSTDETTQWLILGGLAFVVLFIISFTLAKRKRTKKVAEGRNPNTANAIFLAIIGIACLFAEDELFIFIGFVIMFFAWRLYANGKPKLRARTTRQAQSTASSNNSASSSQKNEEEEPVKKRRPRDDPEMKALYRKLMHKYHPDRGRNKEEDGIRNDLTAKINKAYREGDFETLKLFE